MLVRKTAMLPRVEFEPPGGVIGRRSETSIQSGIFFSTVETIDGIVRRIKAEWGRPDALVVATGGLAERVGTHCRTVDRIEPFLTLYGLDLARRAIAEQRGARALAPIKRPRPARRRP